MSLIHDAINDALDRSGGNQTRARQYLETAVKKDPDLLLALVRPYLKAIVAFAISYVVRGGELARPSSSTGSASPKPPRKDKGQNFGQDILDILQGSNAPTFGFENMPKRSDGSSRAGASTSARHAEAIRALARKAPARLPKK